MVGGEVALFRLGLFSLVMRKQTLVSSLTTRSALRATTLSKIGWHSVKSSTFHKAFPHWSNESSLILLITRKLLGCILVICNFLKPLQPCSDGTHQTKNVCRVCTSDTITFAFTVSCRLLLSFHCRKLIVGSGDVIVPATDSRSLLHSELFMLKKACHV